MTSRIRLCGRLEVELDGERVEGRLPGRQGPLVVGVLVLARARPVSRDELIDVLWPGRAPADPDEALSAVLSKVRQALGSGVLQGRRELSLSLPPDTEIDWEQAVVGLERGRAALAGGEPTPALEAGEAAREIASRGFLAGLDSPWVEDRRRELGELRLEALEMVAEAGIALGGARLAGAERAARELVAAEPLREAGHRLLMEALAARGEPAQALGAYEHLRVTLRDELGTTPGAAARAVHERLLAGEASAPPASRPAVAAPVAPVPLPSLLARERGALVGRDAELERLQRVWQEAHGGERQLAVLAGGPGIGKTRLAAELARIADTDGTVLYGACQEEALVAYEPFVEALRHYARARPPGAAPDRLGPGQTELARLIPELAGELAEDGRPAPDDPETRRYLMFEAVVALLDEASERAAVLLVLDDLHWADRSTVQLLGHLARAQHDTRLLILVSYRDSEISPGHPLFELLADLRRVGPFERLVLAGLDQPAVEALIESQAGEAASSSLVHALHSRTEGNPFFVEETVRHLIESGLLFERDGPARRLDEIGVPEGVKEVLARRLARLSQRCHSVLSHASVLGYEFRFDLLPAMVELDEDAVIGALEEALGARLVLEAREGSLFAFTHALVRETLYRELSAPRRQRIHARAARTIEESATFEGDSRAAALALHYRLAGTAADPAKGIAYSLEAGEGARQLFAWDETAAHWAGALELMDRAGAPPAERARLLVALAVICAVTGDLARQIRYLERALELYSELGDDEQAARTHSRLGQAHSLIDSIYAEHLDIERAFRHFDAARSTLERGPVRTARGHMETGVATALTYRLEIGAGIEAAARAMEIAEQLGDEALWAGAIEAYGWHKIVGGELAEGFDAEGRAFESADRGRRPFLAWMASNIRGQMAWGLGDPDAAQAFFESLLELSYVGQTAYAQQLADGIGRCHLSRGELAPARALLPDAKSSWISHSLPPLVDLWDGAWDRIEALTGRVLETSRRTGNRWDEWASLHLAGRVELLRGQPERAVEVLEQARLIVRDGGARYFELWVLPDLARASAESRRLEEAGGHLARCHEIIEIGEDWRGRRAMVEVADAVLLSFEDRPDEAEARFRTALETLRDFKLVAEQADALRQWGLALDRAGDGEAAAQRREAAADLYRGHGATLP